MKLIPRFSICCIRTIASLLDTIVRAIFPDVTVAPFLFIAGTDSKHYTTIADSILRFMPLRMTPQDVALPHNANERIGLHAFKCVHQKTWQTMCLTVWTEMPSSFLHTSSHLREERMLFVSRQFGRCSISTTIRKVLLKVINFPKTNL